MITWGEGEGEGEGEGDTFLSGSPVFWSAFLPKSSSVLLSAFRFPKESGRGIWQTIPFGHKPSVSL